MKRVAGLTAALAIGVLACNQLPTPAACTAAPLAAAVQDPNDPIQVSSKLKVIDPADIDAVDTGGVTANPTGLLQNDLIVSNCNEGFLRRISKINQTSSGGLRPQGIAKVYIETTPTNLETAISKGTASFDFGSLDFANAKNLTNQLAPDITTQRSTIRPQALTLSIPKKVIPLPNNSSIAYSGSLSNNLNPKFNFVFSNGSIERFEVGMEGSLALTLQGEFNATANLVQAEKTIPLVTKPLEYTRAFTIGAIPVVVVMTLEPVVGYALNVSGSVKATASISPTLNMKYGLKYVRGTGWAPVNTPPTFALNPTFTYGVQANGGGEVFVKLKVGVKIYGIAGPSLDNKAYVGINFNPAASNPLAVLKLGSQSLGALSFDLNVLGVGINANFANFTLLNASKDFNCNPACTP